MSEFLSHVLWNVVWSAAIAGVVFLLSRRDAFQQRPALMHILWFGVLLKLIVPAVIAVPVLPMTQETSPLNKPDSAEMRPLSVPLDLQKTNALPGTSFWLARITWPVRLFMISLTGTLVLVSICIIRSWQLSKILCRSSPAPQRLFDQTKHLARDLHLTSCPEVCVVEGLATPSLSLYRWRATIILPRHLLDELDDEQWSCILSHELAHFVRRDGYFNMIAAGISYLFWWNPVAWWAWREMRACQETSCDALALARQPASRRLYAETLLRVVESLNRPSVWQPNVVLGFGNQSVLTRRFEMIAKPSIRPRVALAATLCLCVLAFSFACIPVRAEKNIEQGEADLKLIQGTWKVVEAEEKKVATEKELSQMNIRFAFTGTKFKLHKVLPDNQKVETDGEFSLDTSTSPKQINLALHRGQELLHAPGIYKLNGDTLTICYGPIRPSKFRGESETDQRLYVFERQTNDAESPSGK